MFANKLYVPGMAFIFFGGWALYVNSTHSNLAYYSAGIQGTGSFVATLFIQTSIEFILNYNETIKSYSLKILLAILPSIFLAVITALVHMISDTQEIVATISPSIVTGSIFSIYYAITYLKKLTLHRDIK